MLKFLFGHKKGAMQPSARESREHEDLIRRGNVLEDAGDLAGAQRFYEQATALDPPCWRAFVNLGNALRRQGCLGPAIEKYRTAVQLDPSQAGAHLNLGTALLRLGDAHAAEASYRSAIALRPDWQEAWFGLGCALEHCAPAAAAVDAYRQTLELDPGHGMAASCLARLLLKGGDARAARHVLDQLLQRSRDDPHALDVLAEIRKQAGDAESAVATYRRLLAARPEDFGMFSNYLFTLNLIPGQDADFVFEEHARFGRQIATRTMRDRLQTRMQADKRLRIGYVSPDFRRHSVSCFMEPVLEYHDRSKVAVYCYYDHSDRDEITRRFSGLADHWRDIVGRDDNDVAQAIIADKIDILIDLAGHTSGNRLSLFARKPAPLQFTWLGYLCTTGLDTIDYRICDASTDPVGKSELWQTETPARLPNGQWCYRPQIELPAISRLPMLHNGYCTFGSFNQAAKLNHNLLQIWARALAAIPHSRLRIVGITDDLHHQAILDTFATAGVSGERLEIVGRVTLEEYFSSYRDVDIALDSFPYNGATTTCDALIMGVPVATVAGERPIERGGASLLGNLGVCED